jgi:GxxExxY protein
MEKISYDDTHLNKITGAILDSAIAVHKEMGPGLLESVYQICLCEELRSRGFELNTNVPVRLSYKNTFLNKEYVMDLLVNNEVVVELKSVDGILPVHEAQILSYLRLSKKSCGLLINFNVPVLKQGFKRFINRPLYKDVL